MNPLTLQKPFKKPFLDQLIVAQNLLPFSDQELRKLDTGLGQYEQLFLNPDIEKNLISKNELLASFAISKAENSALTLQEAHEVYALVTENAEYRFIKDALQQHKKLTKKDYEKLEFFNIARTFRKYTSNLIAVSDITPDFIQNLHKELTQGLDIFQAYLKGFDVYKSGQWRKSDDIRVGTYIPASHLTIETGVKELLLWLKKNHTVTSIGIFHTALYALHPFHNGNKRVCRVLEHILLRSIDFNQKNLYSTSYYYHTQKDRYYKYLLYSLERKNLNHFVGFFQEALALSILSVIKTSLEVKRKEFLYISTNTPYIKTILRPLVKRRELQFNTLFGKAKAKMARQTFTNYLQQAVKEGIVVRRKAGKAVFYHLNISVQDEGVFQQLLESIQKKLSFIPDDIKLT